MAFRQWSGSTDANGNCTITVFHNNVGTEWDIYQVSIATGIQQVSICQILLNNNLVCSTPQGNQDTAFGPPDMILNASDVMTVVWSGAASLDSAIVNVWYDEVSAGTYSAGSSTNKPSVLGGQT